MFLPTCPLFTPIIYIFNVFFFVLNRNKSGHLATNRYNPLIAVESVCPLLKKKWVFARFYLKSGRAETVDTQGFAGFLPTFPLFSLISVKKKCKKIYKWREKVGFWPKPDFPQKLWLSFRVRVWYTKLATQLNLLISFTMGELLGNKCFSLNSLYP